MLLLLLSILSFNIFANHNINSKPIDNIVGKSITTITSSFLGIPYILYPLGEGKHAFIDKDPLYRFDGFDCQTFVSTVLALHNSKNIKEFERNIIAVRYHSKKPSFITRNHFTSLDWNKQNIKNGYIQEFIMPEMQQASVIIDKYSWLKKSHNINSQKLPAQKTTINYLPRNIINEEIIKKIPNESVIEIVRINWNLKEKIGTNLLVSHLGFAIRKNNKLYFRHASSKEKKVVEIPLKSYLDKNDYISGIAIYKTLTK